MQLAGGVLAECDWDPSTLLPDMAQLKREVEKGVKMVVITTPGELLIAGGCTLLTTRTTGSRGTGNIADCYSKWWLSRRKLFCSIKFRSILAFLISTCVLFCTARVN